MSLRIENLIEYPDVHIFLGTATILMICIDLQHLIVRLDHHNKLWRALSIIMRRMFVYVCVIHSVIDTACIRWSISWFPRSCWNADPNRRANIHGDFFSTNSQSQLPDHVWLSNLNSTNSHCWSGNLHRLNHHWGHPVCSQVAMLFEFCPGGHLLNLLEKAEVQLGGCQWDPIFCPKIITFRVKWWLNHGWIRVADGCSNT